MHLFMFHLGDYYAHTAHLSPMEDLAYRRIIDLYYLHETPPTGTPDQVARQIRMRDQAKAVAQVLHEFFTEEVGDPVDNSMQVWRHKRCDKEIERYQAVKDGGRKGAAMRWAKGGDSPPIPPLSPPYVPPNANQEPITKNQIKDVTPDGVSDSVFKDYLKIRKAQKKPWTSTAQKLMESEAKKANMSLQQAMEMCCARGWVGFKAEWAKTEDKSKELPLGTDQQIAHAYKVECGGDPTQSRFNSYFEMRKFILDQRDKRKAA